MKLSYAKASQMGVEEALLQRIVARWQAEDIQLHSFMLARHGHVIARGQFGPWRWDERHQLFSLSKTFTATAIGFLVAEGKLSVEDRVLDHFAERLPSKPCAHMREMTVRHLLTMNTGHDSQVDEVFSAEGSWVERFLRSYVPQEPGSAFYYNTPATYMLAALVEELSGEDLLDYLRPRLLEPLGIDPGCWWQQSPEGIATGGFGLNLSCEDIMRFGLFLLRRGEVDGRQLLPAAWFDEASHAWSDNSEGGTNTGDWGQGYGYQCWRCIPEGVYRGDGAFGQYCVIMPEQDMVFAATSGTENMGAILTALWEELLPAIGAADDSGTVGGAPFEVHGAIAGCPATAQASDADAWSALLERTTGRRYSATSDDLQYLRVEGLRLERGADPALLRGLRIEEAEMVEAVLVIELADGDWPLPLCREGWLRWRTDEGVALRFVHSAGKLGQLSRLDVRLLGALATRARVVSTGPDEPLELAVDLALTGTPYVMHWSFELSEQWLSATTIHNVGFTRPRQSLTAVVR